MMPDLSQFYSLWLKPWHLPEGKAVNVTIEQAGPVELHPRPTQTETKIVVSFKGKTRRLILNDTNANKMGDLAGDDWTAWPGVVVSLARKKYTADKETILVGPPVANGNGK